MERERKRNNPLLLIAIVILVLVFLYSGLRVLESTVFHSGTPEETVPTRTIVRDGVEYFPRQDITVVMVAGIDQTGPVQSSESYNNSGDADMVMLLIFDETAEKVDVLSLNRDTMVDMPVLGIGGKDAGTLHGQLALAHTYGTGLEDSCENLRTTVSQFLYGLTIDYYAVMNMDAISILNDAVGGVSVTVTDDFSLVDPTIAMGDVVLNGSQAVNFVRSRNQVGDQLNLNRMARQESYMSGFLAALRKKVDSNVSFILSAYDDVSDYVTTDCSTRVMATLSDRFARYELGSFYSIPGENVMGHEYMEYHADEDALDALILDILYDPKG